MSRITVPLLVLLLGQAAAAAELEEEIIVVGQLEETMIQRVGFNYAGAGRMVYPGLLQLASFMSMNAETHSKAFAWP